ncbi:MAG TPA: choice-of-anchor tandem repeat GloVer-containing protein [Rhizomicrobium sp.]
MNSARVVRTIFLLPFLFLVLAALDGAQAYTFSVLYTFQGVGKDGAEPTGHLVLDNAGNLYGTTVNGGRRRCTRNIIYGCGTAYKLAPDGRETVLRAFDQTDGRFPEWGLVQSKAGSFYGTTAYGGAGDWGTVFMMAPDGTETVLHSFSGKDGGYPIGLAQDSAGNLYGVGSGGNPNCSGGAGCGLVFKVAPDGTDTTLYEFQGGSDGAFPSSPLIKDKAGNFYGTTAYGGGGTACGGQPPLGCGTVFKLTPDGAETILYAFSGGSDGGLPAARVAMDSAGNLYGTTYGGGAFQYGVIFKLTPAGVETVLYSFAGGSDGWSPGAVGFLNGSGNLYGTTNWGGGTGCGGFGCGTVFSLAPDGTETILHSFTGGTDGGVPDGALTADKAGNLYGTAEIGGAGCTQGCGTVFKLTP